MPPIIDRWRPRLPKLIIAGSLLGLAGLLVAPSWVPGLKRLEHQTADLRTAWLADRNADFDPNVAVVLITDTTLQDYPFILPPDRGLMADIVKAVDAAGAKAIGVDFYFGRKTDSEKDAALLAALRDAKTRVVLGALDARGKINARQAAFQRDFIAATGRPAGYLNLRTEPDGIVRFRAGADAKTEFPLSFAALVAKAAGTKEPEPADPISWLNPPWGQDNAFLTLPAEALLAGTDANKAAVEKGLIAGLANKTVLIGGDIAYLDRHATPVSGKGIDAVPGVFVHAQDLAQRMDGRTLVELGDGRSNAAILLSAFMAAVLGWIFGIKHYNLIGWTAATTLLFGADALVFAQMRVILPISLMLAAWVCGAAAGRSLRMLAALNDRTERLGT